MGRYTKDDLDRYFDYNVFPSKRLLYLGSRSDVDGSESGVNYEMFDCFLKGITYLDSIANAPITVHMNTDGGDWYHGMAMFRAIRACRSHVAVTAWGYACSMGSVILQAADTRIVARNCVVMIHDGTGGIPPGAGAKTEEAWAEQSKKTRIEMYQIYLERMKAADPRMTLRRVEEMCSHDRIFSPEEAVEAGLADWVMDTFEDAGYQADGGKYDPPTATKAGAKAAKRRGR
jgi:ATP-dependent protease ClpP protease subunit